MQADKLFEVDLTREWKKGDLAVLLAGSLKRDAKLYVAKHENAGQSYSVWAVWETPCAFGSDGFMTVCLSAAELLEHLVLETNPSLVA